MPATPQLSYVGFGSNQQPLAHLDAAFAALARLGLLRRTSTLWLTQAIGSATGQAPFINGVAEILSPLTAAELKDVLRHIEADNGHPPGQAANTPRPLDLDLLLHHHTASDAPGLRLPHPQVFSRDFVFLPLLELNPALLLPDGRPLASCVAAHLPSPHQAVRPPQSWPAPTQDR